MCSNGENALDGSIKYDDQANQIIVKIEVTEQQNEERGEHAMSNSRAIKGIASRDDQMTTSTGEPDPSLEPCGTPSGLDKSSSPGYEHQSHYQPGEQDQPIESCGIPLGMDTSPSPGYEYGCESEPALLLKKPQSPKREQLEMTNDADEDTRHICSSTMEEAEKVVATLDPKFPSFTKLLYCSHVKKGSVNLPSNILKSNSMDHDKTMVLVDEQGSEYPTKYMARIRRLSGGWLSFCKSHKLVEGDAVVFHLVGPSRFKVYIVRARHSRAIGRHLGPPKISESNGRKRVLELMSKDRRKGKKTAKCDEPAKRPCHLHSTVENYLEKSSQKKSSLPSRDQTWNVKKSATGPPGSFIICEEFHMNGEPDKPLGPCGTSSGIERSSSPEHGYESDSDPLPLEKPQSSKIEQLEMTDDVDENTLFIYSSTMEEAKKIEATLDPKFPSFTKLLCPSHVKKGSLNLPSNICKSNSMEHDGTLVLVDELGKEYEIKYKARIWKISGGWPRFCKSHGLVKGDAVVFHLVGPFRFKVYIVKARRSDVIGKHIGPQKISESNGRKGVLELLNKERSKGKKTAKSHERTKRSCPMHIPEENGSKESGLGDIDRPWTVENTATGTPRSLISFDKLNVNSDQDQPLEPCGTPSSMEKSSSPGYVCASNSEPVLIDKPQSSKIKQLEMMDDDNENIRLIYFSALEEAKKIRAGLDPEFPSFTKLLTGRCVNRGSLNLPSRFCRSNSMDQDKTIVLIDEKGEEYATMYEVKKWVLSTGWKIFYKRHRLVKGDALVFQLIDLSKFKVYIVKARCSHEIARDVDALKIAESKGRKRVHEILNKERIKGKDVDNSNTRRPGSFVSFEEFNGEPDQSLEPVGMQSGMERPPSPGNGYESDSEPLLLKKHQRNERKQVGRITDYLDDNTKVIHSSTMEEADKIRASLDPKFPSFTKLLCRSHINKGFVGLPRQFCKSNSMNENKTIFLTDQLDEEYEITYRVKKPNLCGGWMGFCQSHRLGEGDAVVFQLVAASRFKVYIVRARHSHEVGRDLVPPKIIDFNARKKGSGALDESDLFTEKWSCGKKTAQCHKPAERPDRLCIPIENYQDDRNAETNFCPEGRDQSQNVENSTTRSPRSFVSFEEFTMTVDGAVLDSLLSEEVIIKYYELCRARASYIHDRFVTGISTKLAVEIISETVNIADAIRRSELSTCRDDCARWDKALEGFEVLGMDVGFLRSRIHHLVSLATRFEETPEQNRLVKTRISQGHVDEMIKNRQIKLQEIELEIYELEKTRATLDSTADVLETKVWINELEYRDKAIRPW